MEKLNFVKSYQLNNHMRGSFNELANNVFGLNFKEWFDKGYWTDKYEPFSFTDGEKVIANVSVNKLNLLVENKKIPALQIGTVMTHADYRNLGLSRKLMEKVLEEYDSKVELMYLFANDTVLDFYPKFGFRAQDEHQFSWDISGLEKKPGALRKFDVNNLEDLNFIYRFAAERHALSSSFSVSNTEELLMFYCLYVFRNHIYYLEEEDAIVLFQERNDELHLFDLVSKTAVEIKKIVAKIAAPATKQVLFHYSPDYSGIQTSKMLFVDDTKLFIRNRTNINFPLHFKHPLTSHA